MNMSVTYKEYIQNPVESTYNTFNTISKGLVELSAGLRCN